MAETTFREDLASVRSALGFLNPLSHIETTLTRLASIEQQAEELGIIHARLLKETAGQHEILKTIGEEIDASKKRLSDAKKREEVDFEKCRKEHVAARGILEKERETHEAKIKAAIQKLDDDHEAKVAALKLEIDALEDIRAQKSKEINELTAYARKVAGVDS